MPEVEGLIKALKDLNGFDEVNRILKHADDLPLDKIPKGPLDKVMGPISTVLDAYTTAKGGYQVAEGVDKGDDVEVVDGVHDIIDGGSGILGHMPGPAGALAKAFNAGFTVGDYAAPYVFNAHEDEGAKTEAPSEDGQFHAHTNNDTVDGVIDGTRMISNGDYADGALEIAESGLDFASTVGVPGAGILSSGKDLAKGLWGD